MKKVGHAALMEEEKYIKDIVGKLIGKRQLGRPTRGYVCIIKSGVRERGSDVNCWIDQIRDEDPWSALVNMAMNLNVQ
jgi:hypothetical protein